MLWAICFAVAVTAVAVAQEVPTSPQSETGMSAQESTATPQPEGPTNAVTESTSVQDTSVPGPSVLADAESRGEERRHRDAGFRFGSYGRVVAGTDLEGGGLKPVSVVNHGPRLLERPYLELDLQYTVVAAEGARFRTLVTLAVTDALFHLDGDFDGAITLRNAYVEASEFGVDGLRFWAGSRMVRGDDIYVLDLWPLDNLNLVGAGLGYVWRENTKIAASVGVNQLGSSYQYQELTVAAPSFGTEQLILLDRVRVISALRLEHILRDVAGPLSMKFVTYGDVQTIGAGEFEDENRVLIDAPSDRGYTIGAQVGAWGFAPGAFVNLFVRHARGLSAYGELAVPYGLNQERGAEGAKTTRLALSASAESRWVGATIGGYVEWFQTATAARFDPNSYIDAVIAVRPAVFITRHLHQVFEASYQRRRPNGLSARTNTYLEPAMWQVAVMPTLTLDHGIFARPQIRMIYAASWLNEGARDAFPPGDPRHERSVQHFLGVGAEWWFNSSSYP